MVELGFQIRQERAPGKQQRGQTWARTPALGSTQPMFGDLPCMVHAFLVESEAHSGTGNGSPLSFKTVEAVRVL